MSLCKLNLDESNDINEQWDTAIEWAENEMKKVDNLLKEEAKTSQVKAAVILEQIERELSQVFMNKETKEELEILVKRRNEISKKVSLAVIQHL